MNNFRKPSQNLETTTDTGQNKVCNVQNTAIQNKGKCKILNSKIAVLFLSGYFTLIAGSFIFGLFYNLVVAVVNKKISSEIAYIDVTNILLIITTALGTGLGIALGLSLKSDDKL